LTDYKALTFINLPLLDIKKAPGDTISTEELTNGGQTPDDIASLVSAGALSEDPDAPVHPDHVPVPVPTSATADVNVSADDEGKGKVGE
jgi:hypothetical protein